MTYMNREEELESKIIDLEEKIKELEIELSGSTKSKNKLSKEISYEDDIKNFDDLVEIAEKLINENVPVLKRPAVIRNQALGKKLHLRDKDIFLILNKARNKVRNTEEGEVPDIEFDIKQEKWLWNNLIAEGTLNLVVSMPKVGKSSLISAFLGALTANNTEFLGQELLGGVRSIYICGTDQPLNDWMQILEPVGLAKSSKDKGVILYPLKKLWHKGKPIYLTEEHIQQLEELAKADKNSIFVFDAFASLLTATGLDENHSECVEPVRMLFESLVPTGATIILLHHEGSTNSHRRASEASRGTNALPAEASQIIQLNWVNDNNKNDHKISVSTQGRNSKPVDMIIEQVDRAVWANCGSHEDIENERKEEIKVSRLNPRQRTVLDLINSLKKYTPVNSTVVGEIMSDEYGNNAKVKALANLQQLAQKELIQVRKFSTSDRGVIYGFYPNDWTACENMTDENWNDIEKMPEKVLEGGT